VPHAIQIAAVCLALGLASPAHADLTPTGAAMAVSPKAGDADDLYVMKEVRVVAKRKDSERQALTAAAQQALDEARLRHWKLKKNVTVTDLVDSIVREEDLSAFDLGKARIESVTQERMDGPDGQEAWKCRLVLSLRRK
jgi:hypothetical protein